MGKIQFKILNDENEAKYIPLPRKAANQTISEIRNNLETGACVYQCTSADIEELQSMKTLIQDLLAKGASIELYANGKLVDLAFLNNKIESNLDTARYLQETDDAMLGDA